MAPTSVEATCINTQTGTVLCIPNEQTLHKMPTAALESWRASLPCNHPNSEEVVVTTIHSLHSQDEVDWQYYLNDKISHILTSRAAAPEPEMSLEKRKKPKGTTVTTTGSSVAGHLSVNSVLLWVAVSGIVGALNV